MKVSKCLRTEKFDIKLIRTKIDESSKTLEHFQKP